MPERFSLPRQINDSRYYSSFEAAVEGEITNCSGRTVYVDNEDKIERDLKYYKRLYKSKPFFKGNETLLDSMISWRFESPRDFRLPNVLRKLVENGIYKEIEWFYNRQIYSGNRLEYTKNRTDKSYQPVKPLDLHSNLQIIFYLLLIGIAGAVIILPLERLFSLRASLYRKAKTLLMAPLYLFFALIKSNQISYRYISGTILRCRLYFYKF